MDSVAPSRSNLLFFSFLLLGFLCRFVSLFLVCRHYDGFFALFLLFLFLCLKLLGRQSWLLLTNYGGYWALRSSSNRLRGIGGASTQRVHSCLQGIAIDRIAGILLRVLAHFKLFEFIKLLSI